MSTDATKPVSAHARVPERPDGKSLPYKFTQATADVICEAIAGGVHVLVACQAAGISTPTYYSWRKLGEEDRSGPLWEFREDVKRAEARAELALVAQVRIAGDSDWKAAAWMLEKRYRKRYGETLDPAKVDAMVEKKLKALLAEAQAKIDDADAKSTTKQITDGSETT